MSLTRLLLVVAALYLVWRVLSSLGRRLHDSGAGAEDFSRFSARRRDRDEDRVQTENLVPCDVCGTFVPDSRALAGRTGGAFCSEACRRSAELGTGGDADYRG